MIEEIRKAVHDAALGNQKIAMFHFQVLKMLPPWRTLMQSLFAEKLVSLTPTKRSSEKCLVWLA